MDGTEVSFPWITRQLLTSSVHEERANTATGLNSRQNDAIGQPPKTFVLFVRLPNWKNEVFEICTLRKIKDFTEVFQVKQLLELSAGIPAFAASLHLSDGSHIPDDTPLILGKNISNGYTMHLKASDQWEHILKAVWKGNLPALIHLVTSAHTDNDGTKQLKQDNEKSSCALFVAASRGNLKICKELLKNGTNPNYTTFFGNSFLHSAAFKGNLEILQLLVACGANVRARNVQGQSALDIAVSAGFVDCAKWLWLHQWSIRITKSSEDSPKLSDFIPPAKKTEEKEPTPYRLRLKKPHGHLVKPGSLHHSQSLPSSRPRTAPMRKPNLQPMTGHRIKTNEHEIPVAVLVPEIAMSLKRERSIPSKFECRSSNQLDAGIYGKVNHLHSYDEHFRTKAPSEGYVRSPLSSRMEYSRLMKTEKGKPEEQEKTHFKNILSNLHGTSALDTTRKSPIKEPVNRQEIIRQEAVKSFGLSQAALSSTHLENEYFVEKHDRTLHDTLSESKAKLHVEKHTKPEEKQIVEGRVNNGTWNPDYKSPVKTPAPKRVVPTEQTESAKPPVKSVDNKTQPIKSLKEPAKSQANSKKTKNTQEMEAARKQAQKEKNDKAYNDWLASKQREKISKRKYEILNSLGDGNFENQEPDRVTPVRTWGITYEEWLKSKQDSPQPAIVTKENPEKKVSKKRFSRGKTFDEWVYEKNAEASKTHNSPEKDDQKDEELKEMRKQKFENWVSRKSESARKERRKTEQLELTKLVEMQNDYVQWKSRPRVMSFEEWRKRKQNEIRLSTINKAQHNEVEHVGAWVSQERQELAERAFKRWLLRKQSTDLQRAQSDLKAARKKREKVEAKIQIRLEQLRARKEMRRKMRQKQASIATEESSDSDEEDLETLNNELTAIDNQIKNMTLDESEMIQTKEINEEATNTDKEEGPQEDKNQLEDLKPNVNEQNIKTPEKNEHTPEKEGENVMNPDENKDTVNFTFEAEKTKELVLAMDNSENNVTDSNTNSDQKIVDKSMVEIKPDEPPNKPTEAAIDSSHHQL
uniref:Ankyrin repeat domain-containing protein 11-like n=1 Tax=Phallusia mammillata TaxID=59560 RepID=A0A6F9D5W0_9ASCI|nr:ankyrin repeat domain-containing protein 11-like [Phallusia mammillata]